jgi:glycosyltransferase involved in cell wall biosynthesis
MPNRAVDNAPNSMLGDVTKHDLTPGSRMTLRFSGLARIFRRSSTSSRSSTVSMGTQRLIFLCPHNPADITTWSSIPHFLFDALITTSAKNHLNIKIAYVGRALQLLDFTARLVNKGFQNVGIMIDCRCLTIYAMIVGNFLSVRLMFMRKSTILAVVASNHLAYTVTRRKIIYISDATFWGLCDLYPEFRSLPKWLKDQGHRNEMKTLARVHFALYPSNWASGSARLDYNVPKDRIHQLPFGPCIPENMIEYYYNKKVISLTPKIVVTYISKDWERKGGDLAIDVCKVLVKMGASIRLILIGHIPQYARDINFVDYRGFLRKSDPAQLAELCKAYCESHFLLVPTIAEAFGIVFAEAQAFGVPPVAHDVGGTGSAILAGKTGLLLPLGAPSEMFAERIIRYANDPKLYSELSQRCREQYLQQANWRRWAALILQLSRQTVSDGPTVL